jgi:hypothetical protein
MNLFQQQDRTTLTVSGTRSYASLAKAVQIVNENLYADDIFAEDRIEFRDVYAQDGSLVRFEIDGTPLDFFQIGIRYGTIEEKKNIGRLIDWSV